MLQFTWKDLFQMNTPRRPTRHNVSRVMHWSRRVVWPFYIAGKSFGTNRGADAAASVSYYTLFSVFPLVLLIISGATYFINKPVARQELLKFIQVNIPLSPDTLQRLLDSVVASREAFSLIALVGFFWSASGVFNALVLHISGAFSQDTDRGPLHRRLVALSMVAGTLLLVAISLAGTTILNIISNELPLANLSLWRVAARWVPFFIRLGLIWSLYRFIPIKPVRARPAFWAALATAVAWELATAGFSWYLGSGFARYELVYGSLGTVIALLVWIYLSAWLLIFGAHLAAALDQPLQNLPNH